MSDIHCFNPLNAELNPICCLLALLGAHHFLHVSRIRVKTLKLQINLNRKIKFISYPKVNPLYLHRRGLLYLHRYSQISNPDNHHVKRMEIRPQIPTTDLRLSTLEPPAVQVLRRLYSYAGPVTEILHLSCCNVSYVWDPHLMSVCGVVQFLNIVMYLIIHHGRVIKIQTFRSINVNLCQVAKK